MDIFRCRKAACCEAAAPVCGCDGAVLPHDGAVIEGDAAPMPPAPTADPSAMIPANRRLVHASSHYSR